MGSGVAPTRRRAALAAPLVASLSASRVRAAAGADAAEILAAGAVQHALAALLLDWPGPGPAPTAAYDTVGAQRDRIRAGARPAVAVLSAEAVQSLRSAGLTSGEPLPLGRTGVALAARTASRLPVIDTVADLRAVLEAADGVGWADPARGATAGRVFERTLAALDLDLGARRRLFPFGVEAAAAAARGEIEVAVSQGTELVGRPGLRFLGYLPEPLQQWTDYAAVAISPGVRAEAVLAGLSTPQGRAALRRIGFDGP